MIATPLMLIVDDDLELGLRLTRAVQRAAGTFAAELLLDYAAAVERLQQSPIPHVVVMEYRLHTRTGVELAQWMAVQSHLAATHRVLYTATPPALIVWDPALIAQEAPAADERACVLFALVIAKGAGAGPRALAAALRGLPGWPSP